MPRIAYVNGRYEPISDAMVNIQDRGYQFADGIYEVCLVVDGAWWDRDGHIARLGRSLDMLSIAPPMSDAALQVVLSKVLRKNALRSALIYIQVTRGVAPRNHPFPGDLPSALVITARPYDFAKADKIARSGVAVITQDDIRWSRVDIKSISLLPNVLAKQAAHEQGAAEAMLVRDGLVTEGSSSNMWMIDQNGYLITHPANQQILGGITRATTIRCAEKLQLTVQERAFTVEEALAAKEVFLTSATTLVTPVTKINQKKIANGEPGGLTKRLRDTYIDLNKREAKVF